MLSRFQENMYVLENQDSLYLELFYKLSMNEEKDGVIQQVPYRKVNAFHL